MANLLTVTLVQPLPDGFRAVGAVDIHSGSIQSVQTRTADAVSAGISVINYKITVNNHFKTILLYVSEARAAIKTAANANAVAV